MVLNGDYNDSGDINSESADADADAATDLHDLSALVVIRGEVVLAAGGDGGQDGGVLQGVKV